MRLANRAFTVIAGLSLATPFVSLVSAPATAMAPDCPKNAFAVAHAVTKHFHVLICAAGHDLTYVSVDRNSGRRFVLPLQSTNGPGYVAVNKANDGYYRYVLTNDRLRVTKNGTTILSEAVTHIEGSSE